MIEARTIVVGVDGSEGSLHALRWALGEARLRNDAVEVIHGWHVPYYADVTGMAASPSGVMFTIDVRADRVIVSGSLDSASVPEMSRAVLRLAFLSARQVELDLSNVTFLDCSGLSALLQLQRSVSPFVVAVSAAVQRVLDLTDSGLIFNAHTPLLPTA